MISALYALMTLLDIIPASALTNHVLSLIQCHIDIVNSLTASLVPRSRFQLLLRSSAVMKGEQFSLLALCQAHGRGMDRSQRKAGGS